MLDEKVSEFYIEGSRGKLCCKMNLPVGDEQANIVILCHGLAGTMDYPMWEPLTGQLLENGIGTFRFDFNGCGRSEGEFVNMTINNEIDDLLAVISWVRKQPKIKSISLLGHSQGGAVAGMAAGMCGSKQIRSLCLLSAAASIRDDMLRGEFLGATFDPWHLDKPYYQIKKRDLKIGIPYIQTGMKIDFYETTAKYDGPTLIVNGMADRIVPYTYAERYHAALSDSSLILIPGEDHPYSVNMPYVTKLTAEWLIARLGNAQ